MSKNTLKNIPKMALAFTLATGAPSTQAEIVNGMHGWDDRSKSEFVMGDISTKFLYPNVHWRKRDVGVDCDLLVKDNGNTLATTGFVAQFNAETQETIDRLSPGILELLENWKGQMDYRAGRVMGVLTHLESQHGVGIDVIKAAVSECQTHYPSHGTDIQNLHTLGR